MTYFSYIYLLFFYFSGVYLPLLWEPSFCSKSPIALGYTRGHFCALVPPEPVSQPHIRNYSTNVTTGASGSLSVSTTGASSASYLEASTIEDEAKATYLPLMTSDRKQLLPIHFLSQTEAGNEEVILQQWLDVCATGKKKFLVKYQNNNSYIYLFLRENALQKLGPVYAKKYWLVFDRVLCLISPYRKWSGGC